jgi:hypothetical protein
MGRIIPKQLNLPSTEPEQPEGDCLICGAVRVIDQDGPTLEMRSPDKKITMTVDADLCLECAAHMWRAMLEIYGPQPLRQMVVNWLAQYPVTRTAIALQCKMEPARPEDPSDRLKDWTQ